MATKSIDDIGKRKIGRPRIDAVPILVRVPPHILTALDAFIAAEGEGHSRPNTIRHILEEWLHANDYIKGRLK